MITLFGLKVSTETLLTILSFALFLWSEHLGGNKKIEENTVTAFVYRYLRLNRKEDDKLAKIIKIIKEG